MDNYRKVLTNRFIAQEKEARWATDSFQATTLDELLDSAAANIANQYKTSICVLLLINGDNLVIRSVAGLDIDTIEHKQIPIGKSFSGRLIKRGEPKLFSDVSKILDAANNLEPYYKGSMISTPLVFNRKTIGLLNLYRPMPFSLDDFNIIITYGSQTAFAIESLRLVDKRTEELKEAQAQLVQLNEQLRQDIKARQTAEETLEDTVEKLKQANQELKNFVYIASHDLREPLRKITAFGAMLQQSLKNKLSGDDLENLGFMIDGAARMTKMIEGLLVYSRVSTQTAPAQTVNLNEIVEQLKQLELSVLLEEKNAVIQIPQPLPSVEVDPVQIRQLMQNIIANGIKYQINGNTPLITIISKPAPDDMVRIEVTDNGIGIAPEFQNSIFTMFRRLHSRNEYEGTGIGLAVCKKIVERHNGKIGVESEPGKGSTFWFIIPEAKELTHLNNPS